MLIGPNAGEVSRAWREAREDEKRKKEEEKRAGDKKRIKELEDEVERLRGEVKSNGLSIFEEVLTDSCLC